MINGWLAGEGVESVFRLEDGGVALLVDEGDGVGLEVVDDVAAVRVDILKGEKVGARLGGEADGSKIEKFPFLGAPDRRSLRVHSLNPSDLFRGSDVAEVARGAKD